jgi:predicted DsbA family dithiol-disulfide isomerase
VPFFVVDRAVGASGAQPPAVLLDLLRRARPEPAPVPVVAGGERCGPAGC